jgi:heme/copper-type cytochrome/quinol oxidase subunit 2
MELSEMVKHIFGLAVIAVIYLCILIVVFSPSLYAGWLYLMSRYTKVKRAGLARVAITTFTINAIIVIFLFHFAFNHFLAYKVAEKDAAATQAIQKAVASQENFFSTHGRYYPVGPVRGPYHDDNGLTVEKDIILQVEPHWDKVSHKETFKAYAVHVLGKDLAIRTEDGKVENAPADSDQSTAIRSKLMNSVK